MQKVSREGWRLPSVEEGLEVERLPGMKKTGFSRYSFGGKININRTGFVTNNIPKNQGNEA